MTARTIKLDATLDGQIDAIARSRKTTRSLIIREALAAYVRKARAEPTFLEAAAHLIGSVKGGPRDLASNPRHMQGFGEPRSRSGRRAPRR